MNKIFSEKYVASISILWIVLMASLVILKRQTLADLPLNSIGDFLAGAFAPLGFFWLVAGFYQQGQGLEQNSRALKLQAKELKASTDALNLQAQELKNSVDEQKRIFDIHKSEITAKHFAARPHLQFKSSKLSIDEAVIEVHYDDDGKLLGEETAEYGNLNLEVKNLGEVARHFTLIDKQSNWRISSEFEINKNSVVSIGLSFEPQEIFYLKENDEIVKEFGVLYFDTFGKKFQQKITIIVTQDYLNKGYFHVQHQTSKIITNDD